jgi:hypothetical protein
MLFFYIFFAIGGYAGSGKGLDLPHWVNYIIFPLAVVIILFVWRKRR